MRGPRFEMFTLIPQFRAMRAGFDSDREGLKPAPRLNRTPIKGCHPVKGYLLRQKADI